VGTLKPNDLGLFDVHGNLWQWCQHAYEGGAAMDSEIVQDKTSRVLRGGSFGGRASLVRSADRLRYLPGDRGSGLGFRPARTYN
jgi:formylglycine-generating enzyme required for sulfatase activity